MQCDRAPTTTSSSLRLRAGWQAVTRDNKPVTLENRFAPATMSPAITPAEFTERFPALITGSDRDAMAPLVQALIPETIAPGREIIRYRGRSDRLYFLWQGRLRASIELEGRRLVLGDIGPGKWVGEVTLLDQGPATATVAAVEASQVLVLARADFDQLRGQHPNLAARLIQALSCDLAVRLRLTHSDLVAQVRAARADSLGWYTQAGRRLIGAEDA